MSEVPGLQDAVQAATDRPVRSVRRVRSGFGHHTFMVEVGADRRALAVQFPVRDPQACRRAVLLAELVRGVVPVPEVLFADVDGSWVGRPVLVTRWVDGFHLDGAVVGASPDRAGQIGVAMGELVASLAAVRLPRPGWLNNDLQVEPRERSLAGGILDHVRHRLFESEGGRWLDGGVRERFWRLVRGSAEVIRTVEDERALVHADLAARNVLVSLGRAGWQVAAVLDWEFALSGPPLLDAGHLLRHQHRWPPHFASGVADGLSRGGIDLPENWRQVAWALDTVSLTGPLARPAGHPDRVAVSRAIAWMSRRECPWETAW